MASKRKIDIYHKQAQADFRFFQAKMQRPTYTQTQTKSKVERSEASRMTVVEMRAECKKHDIPSGAKRADIEKLLCPSSVPSMPSHERKEPPKATIHLTRPPKPAKKPSVFPHLATLRTYLDGLKMAFEHPDRSSEIAKAMSEVMEKLTTALEAYDWTFADDFRKEIETLCATTKIYENHAEEIRPPRRQYTYQELDLSRPEPTPPLEPITLEAFLEIIETEEFITRFVESIKSLMAYKAKAYAKLLAVLKREREEMADKAARLAAMGVVRQDPQYEGVVVAIVDIEDLIKLVTNRAKSVDPEKVRTALREGITDPDRGFASLVGREDVKNRLISQLYAFSKGYRTFVGSFNNIVLAAGAGAGKTHVAQVIAHVYSKCGILAKGTTKIVTRADLVGKYIGQTAPLTRAALFSTLEGVLFVDEAYQLYNGEIQSRDFGNEAITEMVNFIDKYVGMSIVILAGYQSRMETFMTANEGLPRRFPYWCILQDYSNEELVDILLNRVNDAMEGTGVEIDDEIANYIYTLVSEARGTSTKLFRNQAGDMMNLASVLVRTINCSFGTEWTNGEFWANAAIIRTGFDEYVKMKMKN